MRIFNKIIVAALITTAVAQAQEHTYDSWDQPYTVQALLGAVQFDALKIDDESGGGTPVEIDLSLMPQLGAAWGTLPIGDRFQYGLEGSFLLGFMFDEVNYFHAGGGGLHINISTSMWMFDLSGGGYANLFLDPNKKVRLYAGAGPLVTYADYRSEREEVGIGGDTYDNKESAFGVGVYARTGAEFRIYESGLLGLGLRGTWSTVDFSDIGGQNKLSGVAAFLSFTAGL